MSRSNLSGCIKILSVFIAAVLVFSTMVVYAAHRINRPVAFGDEPILQTYLYGEASGTSFHKGIDFSAGVDFGDSVYAVAGGRVVDLIETRPDNCHPTFPVNDPQYCNAWGNYVLIQHNNRHFDRTSGQIAYVYSLYLHLRRDQVFVNVNQDVSAGDLIAQADNTGNSGGQHLHFQLVVHPQSDRTLTPFTLDSENRSRNPELWLSPYNGNTGTVVGKVTDANGNAVSNLRIYGLQKQTGWEYGWNETYSSSVLNPDDVWGENLGTTDVTPGTYHLYARWANGTLYRDLGSYTVRANEITFVGLYPVYLPDIKSNYYDWNSSIIMRNNSITKTVQVNTTFFYADGNPWTYQSQQNFIPPQSSATISPPSGCYYCQGSAIVNAGEDVSVVVHNINASTGHTYSYNGIAATDPLNPGWGQVGADIHLPLLMNANNGWSTSVTIFNAGSDWATISLDYYGQTSGGPYPVPQNVSLGPNASVTYDQSGSACPLVGGGRVRSSNGQPLAVTVRQVHSGGSILAYNGLSSGAATVSLPSVLIGAESPTSPSPPPAGRRRIDGSAMLTNTMGGGIIKILYRQTCATAGLFAACAMARFLLKGEEGDEKDNRMAESGCEHLVAGRGLYPCVWLCPRQYCYRRQPEMGQDRRRRGVQL